MTEPAAIRMNAAHEASAWHRATAGLFALAAGLVMVYGLLYMFSTRTLVAGKGGRAAGQGDVVLISARGESVDLKRHLVEGKYTLIDFYADWCQRCQEISPYLEDLARRRGDIALRKVNIENWGTPVVEQYRIRFIPYLEMYSPDGQLLAQGTESVLDQLQRRF
ncbi:MAG: thioredoxin domain-containing protein [Acidobacteriota bacterium]